MNGGSDSLRKAFFVLLLLAPFFFRDMRIQFQYHTCHTVKVDNSYTERVEEFKYLGTSTHSLRLTVRRIHEWRLFFKTFKSNLYSFTFFKNFTIPYSICPFYFFNILLQYHVSNAFMALSSFVPTVHVSNPYRATLQIQLSLRFFFISKLKLFEHSSCFLLLNRTSASLIRSIISFLFFPSSVIILTRYLNFGICFEVLSSTVILIF